MERSRHLLGFIRPVVGGQQKSDAFFAAGVLTRNFHRTPTSPTHSLARASAPLPCARPRVPSLQASRLSPVRHVRHNATVADASEPAVKGAGQVPKPGSEGVMEEPRPANGDADAAGAIVPEDEELTTRRGTVPSLEMTFSCKPCGYRSTHRVSKQGYLHGTVLISCPKCKARHLISDHLKVGSSSLFHQLAPRRDIELITNAWRRSSGTSALQSRIS